MRALLPAFLLLLVPAPDAAAQRPPDIPAPSTSSNTAIMTPGGTDDTPAWNAACAAIPPGASGHIHLQPGTYGATAPWLCPGRGITLDGEGEGVTIILALHTGTALALAPSTMAQPVTVRGLTIQGAAPCATAVGLAVTYPTNQGPGTRTLRLQDLQFTGTQAPATGCNPATILQAVQLTGVWQATVDRVMHNGPHAEPPLAETGTLRIASSYNVHVTGLQSVEVGTGVEVAGYAEGIDLQHPSFVADLVGFRNTPGELGTTATGDTGGAYAGVSFNMTGAECDVWTACVDLHGINGGTVTGNGISLRQAPGQTLLRLEDTTAMSVHHNRLTGSGLPGAAGILLTRAALGHGDLNQVDANLCMDLAGPCVAFSPGTSRNVATGNAQPQVFPGGNFADSGTSNIMQSVMAPAPPPKPGDTALHARPRQAQPAATPRRKARRNGAARGD